MIFRPLFFSIGLRYSGAFGSSGFASFVSFMSVIGVFLGVAALIIVSSVMNGLEENMKDRTMAVVSHAVVSTGPEGMKRADPKLAAMLEAIAGVKSVAPVIESEAIIQSSSGLTAISVAGVEPASYPESDLIRRSTAFESGIDRLELLDRQPFSVILGNRLASSLNLYPGEQVRIMFPRGARYTMAGKLPAGRLFSVVAWFHMGTSDVDSSKALISLDSARRVMRMGEGFDGYRVWLDDPFEIDSFRAALPSDLTVRD